MFNRLNTPLLEEELQHSSAVALLGPRQVGKTTLAFEVSRNRPHIYLDLESERDLAKLAQTELYLSQHLDKLVILDEVHRLPQLFPILRGLIDQARRAGRNEASYLLLGSASLDLLRQTGETLAGRIAYVPLDPFNVQELAPHTPVNKLWLRGGFPLSLLANSEIRSNRWRQDFIRTYLERDVQQFAPRISSQVLRRFWTMLAHLQGTQINVAQLARNLGVDAKTAQSYLDLLTDLLLVRRLAPWHNNAGKRLVKTPKTYVRDTGLLHTLLGIENFEGLLSHPVVGASWEGFVIENVLSHLPANVTPYFYRTSAGAEIDLVLQWLDGTCWAIEIKHSQAPKLQRGFHEACHDIQPSRKIVIYPGEEIYPLQADVQAMPLLAVCQMLRKMA